MTKLYGHWVNCIQNNCVYGEHGKCSCGGESRYFPADGKCLHPTYVEYEEQYDKYGAFRKADSEIIIYAKQLKCTKQRCGEGYTGQCTRGYYGFNEDKQDFPVDGMCLYPDYVDYDKEEDEMGVYEDAEVMEVAV
jgi:hypothetical protein